MAKARKRSVPSFATMIISDSDSASPSSNSRQADQSASGHDLGQTQSSQPLPAAVPGQKRRRLRKQFPPSTPAQEGSRVKLDENIMALCHYQITDRGFADATNMVGSSIEVLRPTSTQTALDAPSGFFTVHLASLKKGLWFPLHSLLIEFLNEVDLLPCQLVPNSHRYIIGYLVRCMKVGVKPTLDHFLFTFKLTKGHGDWASYASLSQRAPILSSRFVSPSNATLLSITRKLCAQGAVEIKKVVTEESLAALGFEFVQDEHRHQPDLLRGAPGGSVDCGPFDRQAVMDEARKAAEDKQRELQEEVARLARELEEEKGHSAALETKNASLSSEVGSVSARVAELEGEKADLIQQLDAERSDQARRREEAIESFKSSPDFAAVAMGRMDKLVVEWLDTEPGVQWMVKEAK
ncbi:unnamed protein product [Cuscuta campestris]|uniref:Transposase (putative) gypsy type domain-containing protein n=1 Tax=Cuscuta campestris TaxID=132261 RepID=A0A484KVJ6_9ASTE|nr:unnamed protein product [Cuscuta campestris]